MWRLSKSQELIIMPQTMHNNLGPHDYDPARQDCWVTWPLKKFAGSYRYCSVKTAKIYADDLLPLFLGCIFSLLWLVTLVLPQSESLHKSESGTILGIFGLSSSFYRISSSWNCLWLNCLAFCMWYLNSFVPNNKREIPAVKFLLVRKLSVVLLIKISCLNS